MNLVLFLADNANDLESLPGLLIVVQDICIELIPWRLHQDDVLSAKRCFSSQYGGAELIVAYKGGNGWHKVRLC